MHFVSVPEVPVCGDRYESGSEKIFNLYMLWVDYIFGNPQITIRYKCDNFEY